jgi:hypothetical protein
VKPGPSILSLFGWCIVAGLVACVAMASTAGLWLPALWEWLKEVCLCMGNLTK